MELQYTKQAKQEFLRIVEIYGEFLANRKHPYRSKSITKYYRMIYYQEGETIWVVDFWDSRQDPAKLSKRIM